MSLPPKPWSWIKTGGNAYVVDATGRKIAAIWGKGEEKEAIADHIISLVNEHAARGD